MWTHPLCATTPCAANLPIGTYNLIFKGRNDPALESTEIVQVGRAPSVLRHTMGSVRYSSGMYQGGVLVAIVGASLLVTALIALLSYALFGLFASEGRPRISRTDGGAPRRTPAGETEGRPAAEALVE